MRVFGIGTPLTRPVPTSKIVAFRDSLSKARVDPRPAKWQMPAELICRCKDGKQLEIRLFETGLRTGAFAVNSVYYRGSSHQVIEDLVRN
jgi:hypothetical protein